MNFLKVYKDLVTFETFGKCPESVGFDANNDLQEDLKYFKSYTFWKLQKFCTYRSSEPMIIIGSDDKGL